MVAEECADELRSPNGAVMLTEITDLVQSIISKEYPDTVITSDEVLSLIDLGDSEGGPLGRHYVLDPVDGTRGFVGLRQYSVCLGMIEDGKVELGVLGCPNVPTTRMTGQEAGPSDRAGSEREGVGVVFAASRGQGAFCGCLFEGVPTQSVHVQEPRSPDEIIFMESYDSRHSDHTVSAKIANALHITHESLRADSQVKYGLLSRGDAHLFMRFPPSDYREKIWDHCAGALILEEAGGIVSDSTGNALDFSKGRWLDQDGGIVAAPPGLHSRLINVLAKDR